jgi:hypothetical protein
MQDAIAGHNDIDGLGGTRVHMPVCGVTQASDVKDQTMRSSADTQGLVYFRPRHADGSLREINRALLQH